MSTLVYALIGGFAIFCIWPLILLAGFVYGFFMYPYIIIRECVRLALPKKWRTPDELGQESVPAGE
jgi:hypothetical protein